MIVTRFAPSPTGYLHVGGARTAIFNWLLARRHNGTFILRIEDTDQKRNTPTAMKQVMDDLRWLGVEWDEGPEVGGESGPYLQSQRLEIYQEYVKKLLDEGKAYYCFETAEELAALREQAEKNKEGFAYKRPEQFPSEQDAENARKDGRPVTVRFAVPQEEIIVKDEVRGEVRFGPGEVGDFIIVKSDGFPTYHFACVVDDELMNVTHVIRGQEHLMNTPGHVFLQRALGFRTPVYAHMSVTVSEGGGKLSKRERPKTLRKAIKQIQDLDKEALAKAGDISTEELEQFLKNKSVPDMPAISAMAEMLGVHLPEINIVDFQKSGYLPETLINFLALLGWNPGGEQEIFKKDELVNVFDLSRLTKSNSFFDRDKLLSFNTEHIKMIDDETILVRFKDYLSVNNSPLTKFDDATLLRIYKANEGSRTLEQMEHKSVFLTYSDNAVIFDAKSVKKVLRKAGADEMLQEVRDRLAAMESLESEEAIEKMLRGLAEEKQVGLGKVAQPLRVALCGTTVSLPIFDSVSMLGRESTLARIDAAIEMIKSEKE